MAIVTNTFTTYSAKGIREDLSNVITNISPEETPYMSNIGRENVTNTLFEWQTDALDSAAANAQLEGDDVTFNSVTATVRLTNYAQIARKTIVLSNTEEVVNKAGRRSELAYQIAKRGSELKRDQEFSFLNNAVAVAGNTTTARVTASLGAFIKTNVDYDTTNGVNPSYTTLPNSARTDGTVRTFTETILKSVIQKVWTQGGMPKILMVGPVNKQRVSGFAGIASARYNINGGDRPATIIGAADIYVSDFGQVQVVPNRFQRERDAWVLDPEYAKMVVLRPYQQVELAKTGDAEKRMLLVEFGHKVLAENAHGLAADLVTS
jgi:hypothetical protein